MFLFGKKKERKISQAPVANEIDTQALIKESQELEKELTTLEGEKRIKTLNKLGAIYFQARQIDKAIYFYETSLEENKALGLAHTDLLKLYNIKRREASEKKDDAEMKVYMDKINALMTLSKDAIRGKL